MPTEVEAPIREWVADTVRTRWLGARVAHIDPLKGDASTRRFWRVTLDRVNSDTPSSAIAIDLGPDDLPLYARALNLIPEPLVETPWLNLHRFLSAIGVPVPELYHADPNERMLLVEDVGSLPLFEAAAHGDAADLYRLAADQLLKLHLDGTRRLDSDCMASQLAYDARLFRWELEQFVEYGIGTIGTHARRAALVPELDGLAARLGAYPRVFSHRDFHGHNLFLQYRTDADNQAAPRLRIIDFQDALMAPAAQDLAVLLTTRDTSRIITPRIEQRVVEYYYAAMMRRGEAGLAANDFFESYWLCVLQHALKVIGRFIYLEREGKPGYSVYVPYAIAQARRALTHLGGFPILRAAVGD